MRALKSILIGAMAAVSLAACASGDPGEDVVPPAAVGQTCTDVDLSTPPSSPVNIRIGHGVAAEEPFWLLASDDEVSQYDGSWYTLETAQFRGTAERLTAYQAGDLDAVLVSPQVQITGIARGALNLYTIATVMREGEPGAFSSTAIALEGSGITSPADMKDKTIAIIDENSHLDFLARQGLRSAGLDPSTDAQFVVLPFPSQEEALRSGQIDVAIIPEPFYTVANTTGGVTKIFDASDLTDFSYDLLTASFDRDFVENNVGVVCAWASDFAAAMDSYRADVTSAKEILLGTDFVTLPAPIYQASGDYARPAGGVVDLEGTAKMMDIMIEFGILNESDRVDTAELVRPGITLGTPGAP